MTDEAPPDHSIPLPLHRLVELMSERGLAPAGTPVFRVTKQLTALLQLECARRSDSLKQLYDQARLGGADSAAANFDHFQTALQETLSRANYRAISDSELEEAFHSQALSEVQIAVDMSAFRSLKIYSRGKSRRTEILSSLMGFRKRTVEFDVLERVFLLSSLNEEEQAGRSGKKNKKTPAISRLADASPFNLKLFQYIPVPDLEMLLPNSRVTMRRLDQAAVFVPTAVSVVLAASKVLFSLTAIWGTIQFAVGFSKDPPAVTGGWGLVAAGSFTLLGIAMGAWTKYQKRRLEYAIAHSKTLYFQTLDSNAGAFLRVVDESFEEEAKEAVLAYALLTADGASTEQVLDERIEAWLLKHAGIRCDFEVSDALAKLERFGVAQQNGNQWQAVAAAQASGDLQARWAAAC